MRILKISLSIIVLFILVCLIALTLLVYFIDPNKLKPVIIKEVKNQTGYQLAIEGPLKWSFYPSLGIKIDHLTAKSPNNAALVLDLHGVKMATDLIKLLHKRQVLKGNMYIDDMRLMNLHLQKVTADLHWQDKVLTLQPLRASLYDGTLEATVHAKQLDVLPSLEWDAQFNNVNIQPLLIDISGNDSKLKLTGVGQVKLQASTAGNNRDTLLNNLNGAMQFSLNNGTVQGIDLNYFIRAADAIIHKQPLPASDNMNQTAYDSLTGSALIRNGVISSDNLLLLSSAFITKGQGNIALNPQTINLQLQVKTQQDLKTQWEIPIIVDGPLANPSVRLDTSVIEKVLGAQEIEKIKDKAKDLIQKHIPGKAGEMLQKLLH